MISQAKAREHPAPAATPLSAQITGRISHSGQASFATMKVTSQGAVLLAGEAGITRLNAEGDASPIHYLEPGDQ